MTGASKSRNPRKGLGLTSSGKEIDSGNEGGDVVSEARNYALRLLGYRARTREEISSRMKGQGYPPEAVDRVIADLETWGYVDDVKFAREWCETRLRAKPVAKAHLALELRARGIDREVAARSVEEAFGAVDEETIALDLAERRAGRYRGLDDETRERRLIDYLRRRGFSSEVIGRVLRRLPGGQAGEDDQDVEDK